MGANLSPSSSQRPRTPTAHPPCAHAVDGPLRACFDEAIAPRADAAESPGTRRGCRARPASCCSAICRTRPAADSARRGRLRAARRRSLRRAAWRAAANASTPRDVTRRLFRQDVCALNLPFRYAAAFFAAGTFQRLTGRRRALDALLRIRAHLIEPGVRCSTFSCPRKPRIRRARRSSKWRMLPLADGSQHRAAAPRPLIDVAARRSECAAASSGGAARERPRARTEVRETTWYARTRGGRARRRRRISRHPLRAAAALPGRRRRAGAALRAAGPPASPAGAAPLPAPRAAAAAGAAAAARESATAAGRESARRAAAGAHDEAADARRCPWSSDRCAAFAYHALPRRGSAWRSDSRRRRCRAAQRALAPDDDDREHRPERDQEHVQEPADARRHARR